MVTCGAKGCALSVKYWLIVVLCFNFCQEDSSRVLRLTDYLLATNYSCKTLFRRDVTVLLFVRKINF